MTLAEPTYPKSVAAWRNFEFLDGVMVGHNILESHDVVNVTVEGLEQLNLGSFIFRYLVFRSLHSTVDDSLPVHRVS